MPDGNNKQRSKWCPILKEWCGDEQKAKCALVVELHNQVMGVPHNFKECIFIALVLILSEISAKTSPPMQKVNLPPGLGKIIRGV